MNKALSDGKLYLEIVKHRERFYHPSYVDYIIYEKDPLSFDELLKNIAAIQEQFRKCVISE